VKEDNVYLFVMRGWGLTDKQQMTKGGQADFSWQM